MSFSVDQMIFVTDNIDGKKHPCKIVKVNSEKKEILVHFINWKKSYDEWLSMDSSRIHKDEECFSEAEKSFQDSQKTVVLVLQLASCYGRLILIRRKLFPPMILKCQWRKSEKLQ